MLVTVGAVDLDYFVREVGLLCGGADPGGLDDGLVDVNGLLEGGTTNGSVDGGLGHADVVAETRLGSSTVLTLDVVDGVVGDQRELFLALVLVMMVVVAMLVVPVGIDLNVSIGVGRTRRPARRWESIPC